MNDINDSLKRAAVLMKMEKNGELDAYASRKRSTIAEGNSYDEDYGTLPSLTEEVDMSQVSYANQAPSSKNGPKLPREILESFATNPTFGEDSVIQGDDEKINEIREIARQTQPKKPRRLTESAGGGSSIDYSLVKMIVEQALKEHSKLNETKTINGSTFFAFGDKIRIVDENGDLYEGKLVKKGNVRKKD